MAESGATDPSVEDETVNWFMYRLLAPRPDFVQTMSDDEQHAMRAHAAYWTNLLSSAGALIFSPVADPEGVWGVAIVEAGTREEVIKMGASDPAVQQGVCEFDVLDLMAPVVAPRVGSVAISTR